MNSGDFRPNFWKRGPWAQKPQFSLQMNNFWYVVGLVWLIIKRSKRKFRKFWILKILDPIFENVGPWAQKSWFWSQANNIWYLGSVWVIIKRSIRKFRKFWILTILDPIFEKGVLGPKSHNFGHRLIIFGMWVQSEYLWIDPNENLENFEFWWF